MTTQAWMWGGAGVAVIVAVLAGLGDWRRGRARRSIEDIGWVPWRGIQMAALFAALAFAILALHGGS